MTSKRGVLTDGMSGMKGYLYDKKKETDVGKESYSRAEVQDSE
jgi:hypothetical protein